MENIVITTDFIKLQQFMKLANMVSQGSDAKIFIAEGAVRVNGETALQRGKKLYPGDKVEFEGNTYVVCAE